MGKNKKGNSIKIVKDSKSEFTFTNDNDPNILETKKGNDGIDKAKENDKLKSKKIENKELKAKGLKKFSTPSTRNHSSIYE